MPTFSVITANFNSGEKLAETAASVLEQDADAEHLIVDGGSTDRSIEIARSVVHDNPRQVRLIAEPDRGIYDAMNKGIRHAYGRYVFFLGAGDRLLPGVLNEVDRRLPPHDRGFIYGDALWSGQHYDGPFDWRKLCDRNVCHQAIFYGRDVFRRCGEYDLRYAAHADWEMNFRCFGRRLIVKQYIPVAVAYFEEGGISSRGDAAFERDKLRLIRRHLGLRPYCAVKWPLLKSHLIWRAGRIVARFRGHGRPGTMT